MSSIPLPALGIHPAQSEDPLAAYGKVASLQGMLQQRQSQALQLQQQQQALKDQQATTAAMKSWDGKSYDDLSQSVLKNGGSANAALTIAQHGQQIKKTASDIAKDDAETGKTNLATTIEKNNQVLGAIDAAKGVPDDQLGQHLTQTAQNLVQQGLLDPQHAQAVQQLAQQPPQQMRGALDVLEKSLMGQKEQFEQAQKTQAATVEQQKANAGDWKEAGPGTLINTRTREMVHGVLPAEQQVFQAYLNNGGRPENYPAYKASQEARATLPFKVQEDVSKQVALQKLNPSAVSTVAPHLVGAATTAFDKAGQEYASSVNAAQNMNDFINEAKAGNKEAVKIVPLQGALEITTAQGVHRINRTEVEQYGDAGSLYDRLAGKVGNVLTGKSITDDVLNDMAKLQQTVAQNAKNLHANKVKTINTTYGAQFQPMTFDNAPTSPAGPTNSPSASSGKSPSKASKWGVEIP